MVEYNSRVIQPIKTRVDDIVFDSKLEAKTYLIIVNYVQPNEVHLQHPVERYEKSRYYREKTWKCDFYIPKHGLLIESKGCVDKEFKQILRDLDYFNPVWFDRLYVVGERHQRITPEKSVWTLDQFNVWMATLTGQTLKAMPYIQF